MALWWLPAILQGAGAVANYLSQKKPPKFEGTPYGQYLASRSKTGALNPTARSAIIGQASGAAGNVAQEQKSDIMGYLSARNNQGSISGARLLAQPDMQRQRIVGEVSSDVMLKNELSKDEAKAEYGKLSNNYATERLNFKNQQNAGLISGLTGAGMAAVQGHDAAIAQSKLAIPDFTGKDESYIKQWVMRHPDPQKAIQVWLNWKMMQEDNEEVNPPF